MSMSDHIKQQLVQEQTITELHFEIEIKGDNPIGVQLIKAITSLHINFNLILRVVKATNYLWDM